MKKLTPLLATVGLLMGGLVSCQKDNTDIIVLSSVAGNFVGKETCPPTAPSDNYTIDLYNQANDGNGKIYIANLYGIGGIYEATVTGNTIALPAVPYEYQAGTTTYTGTISGSGTVDGSILTFHYVLDGDLADECTFVGDRNFRNPLEGNGG